MKKMVVVLCMVLVASLCLAGCKSDDYALAVRLQEAGAYAEAAEVYTALAEYQDSADRLAVCRVEIAREEAFAQAEADYDAAAQNLIAKNKAFTETIASAENALGSGTPLDPSLALALEQTISQANGMIVAPIYSPRELDSMIAATKDMDAVDYQAITAVLEEQTGKLEESIVQCGLVNNPAEEYVVACLGNVPGITGIAPATEKNDPNGNLNKDGGYTAAVFFAHENISKTTYSGDAILNRATSGGGCLEVYRTAEDAQARNTYLTAFDGTALNSGSHTVVGTIVVRVSPKMTASAQDEVEAAIIAALLQQNK